MKQYVLDEPMAGAPAPIDGDPPSLRQPGRWRWILLVVLLEPIALAILYVSLSGGPSWSQAAPSHATTSTPIAYAASFSFPRQAEAAPAVAEQPAEPRVSKIAQERGRYVIDLQDMEPGAALAMLAQATKARVAGANIFAGSPVRLTRSAVAGSPREAWQTVFGDVANFAVACAGAACEVRFVSLAKPGSPARGPETAQSEFVPEDPAVAQSYAPVVQMPVIQAAPPRQALHGDVPPEEN
jgi:hypothetical protein